MPPPEAIDRVAEAFQAGIACFNRGAFFEAHEAWEGAWLPSEGRARLFYHGLIQAAAAFVHLQRNQRKGAQLLYQKSHDKLQHFEGSYLGLEIGALKAALAEVFREVCAEPPEAPIEGQRYVVRAPQIQWHAATAMAPAPPEEPGGFVKDESKGRSETRTNP